MPPLRCHVDIFCRRDSRASGAQRLAVVSVVSDRRPYSHLAALLRSTGLAVVAIRCQGYENDIVFGSPSTGRACSASARSSVEISVWSRVHLLDAGGDPRARAAAPQDARREHSVQERPAASSAGREPSPCSRPSRLARREGHVRVRSSVRRPRRPARARADGDGCPQKHTGRIGAMTI